MTEYKLAINWGSLVQTATPNLAGLSLGEIISQEIIPLFFPVAGVAMLIYLIYGGYTWMLSSGDPKKVAQAQGIITNAIIGFIIIFASYWIVQLVGELLDIQAIRDIF